MFVTSHLPLSLSPTLPLSLSLSLSLFLLWKEEKRDDDEKMTKVVRCDHDVFFRFELPRRAQLLSFLDV